MIGYFRSATQPHKSNVLCAREIDSSSENTVCVEFCHRRLIDRGGGVLIGHQFFAAAFETETPRGFVAAAVLEHTDDRNDEREHPKEPHKMDQSEQPRPFSLEGCRRASLARFGHVGLVVRAAAAALAAIIPFAVVVAVDKRSICCGQTMTKLCIDDLACTHMMGTTSRFARPAAWE